MHAPPFDAYCRYDELARTLQEYARAYRELVHLESIGKSLEGRELWLLTVTRFSSGAAGDKPAFWVDGNIHAAELAGSMACLKLLDYLIRNDGVDEQVTACLDSRVFYICPRVNPDGAEWALERPARIIRSSTRPYPWPEPLPGGLTPQDMDGDGRILMMRIADPNGPWKVSGSDPRVMVRRDPVENGGTYYRLLPEGIVEHFDGTSIRLKDKREQLDLNRNFPSQWREEHEQQGAGPFPASEPEVHAITRFIADHPNICGGITFHTYSGVLLRPYSYRADEDFPAEDLRVYRRLGEEGTRLTGYPAASVYHEFRYHPQQVITGALDDWLYEQRGVFAWTVEIWSPQRAAGIDEYKYLEWYEDHPEADDLKLMEWNDRELNGEGFVPWYNFEHPQLGTVQLGGWDNLFTWFNPPPGRLNEELERFPAWLVWHNLVSPRLQILAAHAETLGGGHYRVNLTVQNTGWLPTYVSKNAEKKNLTRGVICEITLPEGAQLAGSAPARNVGQLEGRAYKATSPTGWAGRTADPTDDRMNVSWLIHGAAGGRVTVTASHDRAGRVTAEIILP